MKKSLFSSGNASKKSMLFRESVFVENGKKLDEIARKNKRSAIRKYISAVAHFFETNNKLSKEQLDDFVATYKETYINNDFSVASLYDGNDETKKASLRKLLEYVKKNNK